MSFFSSQNEASEHTIVRVADTDAKDDGGFQIKANVTEKYVQPKWWETDLLPEGLRHNSGHDGSHSFITHEFIDSLIHKRQPKVNIYEALAYTAPGIIAHESALKNGEQMKIPNFDK